MILEKFNYTGLANSSEWLKSDEIRQSSDKIFSKSNSPAIVIGITPIFTI